MATIYVEASSIDADTLRRALVAHRRVVQPERFPQYDDSGLGETPQSVTTTDCRRANGGAFVAVDGCTFNFRSMGLNPAQAAFVIAAINGEEA